jgi:hypothetical protein
MLRGLGVCPLIVDHAVSESDMPCPGLGELKEDPLGDMLQRFSRQPRSEKRLTHQPR